jgi:membrane-bound lytic murein transglycosylase D
VRGSRFFGRLSAALFGALVAASVGIGSAGIARAAAEVPFPRPATIEPNVDFWVNVFTAYSVRDFVLVDSTNVWRVYAVYRLPGEGQPSRDDIQWVNVYLKDKYSHILDRLASGEQPITYDERRVAALFKGQSRYAYRLAEDNLRVQEGLRERFRKGLVRSRYYRATMERIFRDAGLPPELVTLAQIESGFQTRARSSAGAAGIWQFTRSTGRQYMHVSRYRDDRLNPYRATIAAAKLLRSNYDLLGDWPLAITAYNYGTGGVARAANQYDGDYGKLIQHYNGPHFGFAVKNYYAEFLAALQVHRYEDAYFPGIQNETAQIADTHSYTVRHGDTPSSIASRFGISPSRLMDANGISNARYLRVGATLVIPAARMGATADNTWRQVDSATQTHHAAAHAASHSDSAETVSEHSARHHRMRRGETLYRVADDYDVPVKALMKANRIENPRRVRAGTMLVIPQI